MHDYISILFCFFSLSSVFTESYIGKKYKKAVYRRYTDQTFQKEVPQDSNIGFMGPVLRAHVSLGAITTVRIFALGFH